MAINNYFRSVFVIGWFLFSLTFLSGCQTKTVMYENESFNFSLQYPSDWEFSESERLTNVFSLGKNAESSSQPGVYIMITMPITRPESTLTSPQSDNTVEELTNMMEHILDVTASPGGHIKSLEIISISDVAVYENHAVISATIAVPTVDITNPIYNQMGEQAEDVLQLVDLYLLRSDDERYMKVRVFKGTDESLNLEADEIVRSIRFIDK